MENSWLKQIAFSVLIILVFLFQTVFTAHGDQSRKEVQVGVILDMGSREGKVIGRSITMALSDFYALNPHYTTRIVTNMRDTHGEPMLALSSALDLLEKTKVQAIIGPESTVESRFLEVLGEKANVPFLSFSTSPLSNHNPYFLQIAQDETTQFKAIATMIKSFKWNNVVLVCEGTANGRVIATYAANAFQETNIRLTYTSYMSTSSSNDQILKELYKLQNMQATVFVIHTPLSLSSNLFSLAKELGMMGEGYIWIVTSKTTNFLNSVDAEAMDSMQGVVGFKSYFPKSKELHIFVSKWRRENYDFKPIIKEFKERDSNGIWAYDAVYALAMAVEKVRSTVMGASLLKQISRTKFHGLGGEFNLMNGKTTTKAMEVINVIGKGDRKVGFWIDCGEFVKEITKTNLSSNSGLESIIWPGAATAIPTRRMLQLNTTKLRFLVPHTSFRNLVQMVVDPITNLPTVSGFCGEVFNFAFDALKYDVDIEFVPFNGTYHDLIDTVYHEEFDGAVGDITITSNRTRYVDFTSPFSDLGVGTLARTAQKSMWIFLDPLSAGLWFTSAAFFLFLGFVIWFIEHRTNEEFQGSTTHQIGTTLWFAFSTLVFAHREKLHSNLSRFVVTIWVFVVLVLTSSYTATLSSLFTVQQIASNGGFVQLQSGSPVSGIVLNNLQSGSPVSGIVLNNLQINNIEAANLFSPHEYAHVLRSEKANAIIDEILYIKSIIAMYSAVEFSLVATASITSGFGIVFKKGSPLTKEMSAEIAKLREAGTLESLEDKWLKHQSSMMPADSFAPPPTILNIYGFGGLFLISGVSMVLVLLVSSVNIFLQYWNGISKIFWRY